MAESDQNPCWKSISRWCRDYEWPAVGAIGILALVLGIIGFQRHFENVGQTKSALDLFYLALQLFPLQSGVVEKFIPWELEVARLLAPGIAAYTAAKALMALFYQQFHMIPLYFIRDHVIICGLGEKGSLLARGFITQEKKRVVVIEKDPNNRFIEHCRKMRATVLIGNATNADLLCKAQLDRAKYLVCVMGDEGANVEVAVEACKMAKGRKEALNCFVHLTDPELCYLLREREFFGEAEWAFRLEFFNIYDSGAMVLLKEHPYTGNESNAQSNPHLVVLGMGRMGQSLVIHWVRDWRDNYKGKLGRLRITIVDREAKLKQDLLCKRYPSLNNYCEFKTLNINVHSPEFRDAPFLFDNKQQCDITSIYVCFKDDSLAVSSAMILLQHVRDRKIPILVRMTHDAGLANLLRGVEGGGKYVENLKVFGMLDHLCNPDVLLNGRKENLAQASHEAYVQLKMNEGVSPEENKKMAPWEILARTFKESNRQQVDHFMVKLGIINCGIAPVMDLDVKPFEFQSKEIEKLSEKEHERWWKERLEKGWIYGPEDKERKINLFIGMLGRWRWKSRLPGDDKPRENPCMRPWGELDETTKDIDRMFIRKMPELLARIGLQIYRKGERKTS